jgi:hypothetical protein
MSSAQVASLADPSQSQHILAPETSCCRVTSGDMIFMPMLVQPNARTCTPYSAHCSVVYTRTRPHASTRQSFFCFASLDCFSAYFHVQVDVCLLAIPISLRMKTAVTCGTTAYRPRLELSQGLGSCHFLRCSQSECMTCAIKQILTPAHFRVL